MQGLIYILGLLFFGFSSSGPNLKKIHWNKPYASGFQVFQQFLASATFLESRQKMEGAPFYKKGLIMYKGIKNHPQSKRKRYCQVSTRLAREQA